MEDVAEALQAIGAVLANIEEALHSKQCTRRRGMREHELRNVMAEVDRQLLVTTEGEETDQ